MRAPHQLTQALNVDEPTVARPLDPLDKPRLVWISSTVPGAANCSSADARV